MPVKKQPHSIPADKVALFEKLVSTNPEIEHKGAANPYTAYNGHMFTLLSPDGVLSIRLPEKEREEFLKKDKTNLSVSYGILRKEYVDVPDTLLKNTKELKKYFDISLNYIKTLKPKATTKSKK